MSFTASGLAELIQAFEDIEELPDEVVNGMLEAEADVVVEAQKETAEAMLDGPYNKNAVKNAITKGRAKKTRDGRDLSITFEGEQHGNRIAEIAFVNEYGKTNQPARPFIRMANEKSEDEAADKAAEVYDKFLRQKGL